MALYAKGMTTTQISETVESLYGFEISEGMVSDITDKIMPKIEDWQNRPLSAVYPIVFIDAIHFSVRNDGIVSKLAAYVVLGINEDGHKEVQSIEIGENEVRKAFYTTNSLESLNSCYRRLNKQRSVFPSPQALLKALYMATFEITKRWTVPIKNWGRVRGELSIMYPNRLSD